MRWIGLVVGLAAPGCGCGSYEISTGFSFGDTPVDGAYHEDCGARWGSTGSWDLFGDGGAEIWFETSASGDRDWNSVPIDMALYLPIDRLVPGAVFGIEDLWGNAQLGDMSGNTYAHAGLTAGHVEIVAQKSDPDADPCDVVYKNQDGPAYLVDWDATFEGADGEGAYRYEATGRDTVQFSTFLSESCPSDF